MAVHISVNRTLHVIAATWGLLWVATLTATLFGNHDVVRNFGLAVIVLFLEAISLAALIVRGDRAASFVMAIVTGGAFVNALNIDQHAGTSVQLLTTTWLNLATIVVAFVSSTHRRAVQRVVGIVSMSGALLIANASTYSTFDHAKYFIILPVAYALAVGLAVAQAAKTMRRATEQAMEQAEVLAIASRAEAEEQARTQESNLVARLLHDTVINTLGAIRKGISNDMIEIARQRCASNLVAIQQSVPGGRVNNNPNVGNLCDEAQHSGGVLGLQIAVECPVSRDRDLPDQIYTLARSAIHELLTNVSKHAEVADVEVYISISEHRLTIKVSDCGLGWDEGTHVQRSGLARSVVDPCESVGGQVSIETTLGSGTTVTANWPLAVPTKTELGRDHLELARNNAFEMAMSTSRWLLMLAVFEALLFIASSNVVGNIIALAVLGSGVALVRSRARHNLNALSTSLVGLAIAGVIAIPMLGNALCRADVAQAWGVDGAAALIIMVCVLGPKIYAPIISSLGVVAGLLIPMLFAVDTSGCAESVVAVLPIEIGTVLAVTAFRHHLEKLWKTTQVARKSLLELEQNVAASRGRASVRTHRLNGVVEAIEPLLQGIGDGRLDPQREEVKLLAGQAETTLRSLLLLDDRLVELGNVISQFVTQAYKKGMAIRVVSGEYVSDPSVEGLISIRQMLSDLLDDLLVGINLTVGLFVRNGRGVLTVVISASVNTTKVSESTYDDVVVQAHRTDDETLLEVSWQIK